MAGAQERERTRQAMQRTDTMVEQALRSKEQNRLLAEQVARGISVSVLGPNQVDRGSVGGARRQIKFKMYTLTRSYAHITHLLRDLTYILRALTQL
eukprot:5064806-Pyramimonas_sp.AAC.1